jgi:hypothetical protein
MPCRLALLVVLVCLGGCAALTASNHTGSVELIPMAAPIGPERRIVQQITAVWTSRQAAFLCVLELDKHHIAIAGLSADGISLFNVNYDGNKLVLDKSPLLPDSFSPEHIIKDLQLVYWPVAELQKLLPRQWRLEADKHYRRLYFNSQLRVEVNYRQPDASWPKTVDLTNQYYHYQLHINTLSYDAVSE